MIAYPVRIHVKDYRGKDQKKRLQYQSKCRLALQIEEYLNAEMVSEFIRTFTYDDIASKFGTTKDAVRETLYPVDCGDNGITIRNDANNPESVARTGTLGE